MTMSQAVKINDAGGLFRIDKGSTGFRIARYTVGTVHLVDPVGKISTMPTGEFKKRARVTVA
jgi:hypothetical protein